MSTNYVHLFFTVLLNVSAPTGSHHQRVRIAFTNTSLSRYLTHAQSQAMGSVIFYKMYA